MSKGDRYLKIVAWSTIEETILIYEKDGKELPAPMAGRDFVNLMQQMA